MRQINMKVLNDILKETKEFVIWGIAPGKKWEEVLFTKAKNMGEAKKVLQILTSKHGVKKGRITVLDLEQDPSEFWKSGKMFEGLKEEYPDESEAYKALDKVLDNINGVSGIGYSDFDSRNRMNVGITLVVKKKIFPKGGGMQIPEEFKVLPKDVVMELKKRLKKAGFPIIGKIYTPKKKSWKDNWGDKESGYVNDEIELEVEIHQL